MALRWQVLIACFANLLHFAAASVVCPEAAEGSSLLATSMTRVRRIAESQDVWDEEEEKDTNNWNAFVSKAAKVKLSDSERQRSAEEAVAADRAFDIPIHYDFKAVEEADGEGPSLRDMIREEMAAVRSEPAPKTQPAVVASPAPQATSMPAEDSNGALLKVELPDPTQVALKSHLHDLLSGKRQKGVK